MSGTIPPLTHTSSRHDTWSSIPTPLHLPLPFHSDIRGKERCSTQDNQNRLPPVHKFHQKTYPAGRLFITVFTKARHSSLSRAICVQSTPSHYLCKIHFNIILPSTPKYSIQVFQLRFCRNFSLLPYAPTCPPLHPILLHLITLITSGEVYKLWSSSFAISFSLVLLPPS